MIWWQYIIPQHSLSKLMFRFARLENIWLKNKFTHWFVKSYQVNLSEAVREKVEDYQHFNDFFTRALKPEARKIGSANIVCPVDGTVSQSGEISHATIFQAKNHYYTVSALLGGDYRANQFESGYFSTIFPRARTMSASYWKSLVKYGLFQSPKIPKRWKSSFCLAT